MTTVQRSAFHERLSSEERDGDAEWLRETLSASESHVTPERLLLTLRTTLFGLLVGISRCSGGERERLT
jgi:hypothetical protein